MEIKHPYSKISDTDKEFFLEELNREITDGHRLFGLEVTPIAKNVQNDDILFQLSDGRLAVVHLTWSGRKERDSNFPWSKVYDSLEALSKGI